MNINKKIKGFVLLVLLLALFGMAGVARAADYYVSTTGSDSNDGLTVDTAWKTIQHAADTMVDGDTSRVQAGIYTEQINVTKSVILEGENPANTSIVGGFNVVANGVTINNFNISEGYVWQCLTSGNGDCKAGILSKSSNNAFNNNRISNIIAGTGTAANDPYLTSKANNDGGIAAGIFLISANNNLISNNIINGITGGKGADQPGGGKMISGGAGGVSAGIYFDSAHTNTIKNNTITNLSAGNGGTANPNKEYYASGNSGGQGGKAAGFFLNNSTNNNILSNTVTNLTAGNGGSAYAWEAGGTGGVAAGVLFQSSSTGNALENNDITSLSGGLGGVSTWQPRPIGMFGTDGSATGIWIKDNNSLNNSITPLITDGSYLVPDVTKLNMINSKPLVYIYGKTSVKISSFDVTTPIAPITIGGDILTGYQRIKNGSDAGISTAIAFINTNNSTIQDISISGFTGLPGGTGGYLDIGGNGAVSTGIYLHQSSNNNLNNNAISSLVGGAGGSGGTHGTGGAGGFSTAVYMSSSNNNMIQSNAISSLTGGTGGQAGNDGAGGTGGISMGFYFESSINNTLQNNSISSLSGGYRGELADPGAVEGTNGASTGIWMKNNSSLENTITPLTTEDSYLVPDITKLNTIDSKPIIYVYGQANVKIADFDISVLTPPITIGGSIQTGEYSGWEPRGIGGSGGISTGIALINTTNSLIEQNTISGFKAMPGGSGGYAARYLIGGGTGGVSAGIYLASSTNTILQNNIVVNLKGGTGGSTVEGSTGGTGGDSIGIYLRASGSITYGSNSISGLIGGNGGFGSYYEKNGILGYSHDVYTIGGGNTYYVSLHGKNTNNGLTIGTPWKKIAYAAQQAKAGDTVIVWAYTGTYAVYGNEYIVISNSGTETSPITLRANGEVILEDNYSTNAAFTLSSKPYVTIDGFTIKKYVTGIWYESSPGVKILNNKISESWGAGGSGIVNRYSNNTFIENNTVYNSGKYNIYVYKSDNVTVKNNIVYNDWSIAKSSPDTTSDYGFKYDYVTNSYSENNIAYNSGWHGWRLRHSVINNTFKGDKSYNNGGYGFELNENVDSNTFIDCIDDGNNPDYPAHTGLVGGGRGFAVYDKSDNNTFINATIRNEDKGFDIRAAWYDEDEWGYNVCTDDDTGAYIGGYCNYESRNNRIINSTIENVNYGFRMYSPGNIIEGNKITGAKIYDYHIEIGPDSEIIDPSNKNFTVKLSNSTSSLNIRFKDNKVFSLNPFYPVSYEPTRSTAQLNGITPIITITTYNISARPISGSATVTVNKFDTSLAKGSVLVDFSADTANGNNIDFVIGDLKADTNYQLTRAGANYHVVQSNANKCIAFSNSEWSAKTFTITETDLAADIITPPEVNLGSKLTNLIDINQDGTIDISDLRIVALHFGESTTAPYPRYDVDANGTVDILDLRQVAGGM